MEIAMSLHLNRRHTRKNLLCDERGAAAVILTIYLPFLVGLFTLAVDMSYVLWSRNMLQVTAEAAALAATTQLPDKTASITLAKQYAQKNMSVARYGSVLKDADVVLGKWTDGCVAGGAACFAAAGSQTCEAFKCNAVMVTTRQAATNGNALNLVFAPLIGLASFNVSATAIAKVGPGPGSQSKWNVVIVEDISSSFSEELPSAKAADLALLDCIKDNAAAGSKLGIALFTGVSPSTLYQGQLAVSESGNYNTLKNKISGIQRCDSPGMPKCSGSNVSSGMSAAITNMCPNASDCPLPTSSGSKQALVILTDGIPNCGSQPNCSNSSLKAKAVQQADRASSEGIDVFTIYYGDSDSDANWLATLVRGNGQSFKTPDPSKLAGLMQQVCTSSLAHRLVW
jgi:Flp pilus assembly protein TadG